MFGGGLFAQWLLITFRSDLHLHASSSYGHQLPGLIVAAKAAPKVNFVVDHFGSPADVANDDAGYKAWQETMTELAKLPNVYCKISGLMPVLGFN